MFDYVIETSSWRTMVSYNCQSIILVLNHFVKNGQSFHQPVLKWLRHKLIKGVLQSSLRLACAE